MKEFYFVHNGVDDWKEIVSEVPSHEQWQEYVKANDSMFSVIKMLNKDNYQLEKENNKLKELLKECRGSVEGCLWNARMCESYADTEYFKGLIVKIDEMLR